jgi:transposase
MLRHRISLVRLGTQLRNRIHAVAADHGYDRSASYWTGPGRGWLAELDLPPVSREIIADCLAVIDGMAPVTGRLDGELHQHAKGDPRVKALTTLPGVGEFTALVMLAEIGDISRFPSARKLASWAGLTRRCAARTGPSGTGTSRARLSLAAVGHEPGRADRQAVPGLRRQLHRHRQQTREEDRHHRDRPQAADPRLASAVRNGSRRRQHAAAAAVKTGGPQAPGALAHSA